MFREQRTENRGQKRSKGHGAWGKEKLKTKKEKPKLKSKKLRREHEVLGGWTGEKTVPQMRANGTYAKTVFRINTVMICKNGVSANIGVLILYNASNYPLSYLFLDFVFSHNLQADFPPPVPGIVSINPSSRNL